MHAKTLLVLSGLAALGSAFTLPGDLANGLYEVSYNEVGEEVHRLVKTDFESTYVTLDHTKRGAVGNSRQTWCGCAFPMNAGDTNIANQRIADYASSSPQLGAGAARYAIQNSAVSFICNFSAVSSITVPSNLVSNNAVDISYNCGNFIAGTSRMRPYEHTDYGYMNYSSGLNFCGAAEFSKQGTCPDATGGKVRRVVRGSSEARKI
ncbi:hypothetical protein VE01_07083 [Pseudogymnoascus verrucosus]|uniref:Uncharacterized protein n=1 Tax=Pseudogymnoascus verrucosus TaxID=342668 RepID=A0A1B8GE23_9PEZI|nr:uncharacterized protein VE01_07083 [Pseudogymnoascus verrucosus]OBT94078.1 hypothetical protein VE01_07083 [Pseudogymnoascus verrucosus]